MITFLTILTAIIVVASFAGMFYITYKDGQLSREIEAEYENRNR